MVIIRSGELKVILIILIAMAIWLAIAGVLFPFKKFWQGRKESSSIDKFGAGFVVFSFLFINLSFIMVIVTNGGRIFWGMEDRIQDLLRNLCFMLFISDIVLSLGFPFVGLPLSIIIMRREKTADETLGGVLLILSLLLVCNIALTFLLMYAISMH